MEVACWYSAGSWAASFAGARNRASSANCNGAGRRSTAVCRSSLQQGLPVQSGGSGKGSLGSCQRGASRIWAAGADNGAIAAKAPTAMSAVASQPSVSAGSTELDAVYRFSEVVPDLLVFDDFARFPPTAATVSASLLIGLSSLPDSPFKRAIDGALAFGKCVLEEAGSSRMSCVIEKALINVGAELAKVVPGRVSTEVDARLAYDTQAIINKVHRMLKLYSDMEVPQEKILFKIPATFQGIEAAKALEAEKIQTHLTLVYSFAQAAACAQAGVSVIQLFVGRTRDWARNNGTSDPFIDAAVEAGQDPGVALASKVYNYIQKNGFKTKVMAAAIRNKQDVFSLLGVDYMVVPVKVLTALKEAPADLEGKYAYEPRLSPAAAKKATFTEEEAGKLDGKGFKKAVGPAAVQMLEAGLQSYIEQQERAEEHFDKIWPPPNV